MAHQGDSFVLTRRGVLALVAGACVTRWERLYGFSSDFWNKKDPGEWSSQEIEQLTSKSPWAKEVSAQANSPDEREAGGMGGPGTATGGGMGGPRMGGGGMGGPRMGGPGMGGPGVGGPGMGGGRRRGGGPAESFKGTVRWESAKPVLDALKTPLAEAFANRPFKLSSMSSWIGTSFRGRRHPAIGAGGRSPRAGRALSRESCNSSRAPAAATSCSDSRRRFWLSSRKTRKSPFPRGWAACR